MASFTASAAEIARWDEDQAARDGVDLTSRWNDVDATEMLSLCYFDGDFGPSRGPYDPDRPNYDRIIAVVTDDGPVLVAAGYQEALPVADPARSR